MGKAFQFGGKIAVLAVMLALTLFFRSGGGKKSQLPGQIDYMLKRWVPFTPFIEDG